MQHTKVISVPTKMYDGSASAALKKKKVINIISEDKQADTGNVSRSRSAPRLTFLMLMILGDESDTIDFDDNKDWFMDGKKDSFVLTERRLGKARNRQVRTSSSSSKRNADWIHSESSSPT